MNRVDVTVLVSVKSEESYIGPTIKSILDQTYKNFELWIIDDGSTDDTWQVVKTFRDKRIKLFHFDNSQGLAARLNWAVPKIKTKFIARMDSHNLADPMRLAKQHTFMLKHPEVMALGSNFTRVTPNKKVILRTNFPTDYITIKQKLLERNLFKHASMFFRRDVYNKVGLYKPYFRVEDYDFMLRVTAKFPVANLSESLITEIYIQDTWRAKKPVRWAFSVLALQIVALTSYGYPLWQAIYLVRTLGFIIKNIVLEVIQ